MNNDDDWSFSSWKTHLSSPQHRFSKQEVFPESCYTDLSMSLCRSSCIHSPLYYPTSTHKKLNLFLEIAFTLHNTHGMIASALILFLTEEDVMTPFSFLTHTASPHQHILPVRGGVHWAPAIHSQRPLILGSCWTCLLCTSWLNCFHTCRWLAVGMVESL